MVEATVSSRVRNVKGESISEAINRNYGQVNGNPIANRTSAKKTPTSRIRDDEMGVPSVSDAARPGLIPSYQTKAGGSNPAIENGRSEAARNRSRDHVVAAVRDALSW